MYLVSPTDVTVEAERATSVDLGLLAVNKLVGPTLDGKRLAALSDQAHLLGVNVVLWATPAHLSNSSPLIQEHPDWLMWSCDGTPEVSGYGDYQQVLAADV